MNNNKALVLLSASLLSSCLLVTVSARAADGKQLFQQHCSRCHQSARHIKSPADQISPVLQSENIRAHRFTLDDLTIQAIIDYIDKQQH